MPGGGDSALPSAASISPARWSATDLQCFASVTGAECDHHRIGPGRSTQAGLQVGRHGARQHKAAITGTCRAISIKHAPRYPAQFERRFNWRHDLAAMIPRPCWAGVPTVPMPCLLLKLAEVRAFQPSRQMPAGSATRIAIPEPGKSHSCQAAVDIRSTSVFRPRLMGPMGWTGKSEVSS